MNYACLCLLLFCLAEWWPTETGRGARSANPGQRQAHHKGQREPVCETPCWEYWRVMSVLGAEHVVLHQYIHWVFKKQQGIPKLKHCLCRCHKTSQANYLKNTNYALFSVGQLPVQTVTRNIPKHLSRLSGKRLLWLFLSWTMWFCLSGISKTIKKRQ